MNSVKLQIPSGGASIVLNLMPDAILIHVGHIVLDWAALDNDINVTIDILLNLNERDEPGWQARNFPKRKKLLTDEACQFFGSRSAVARHWELIAADVGEIAWRRNTLAHSPYLLEAGRERIHFYGRRKGKPVTLTVEVEHLGLLCQKMAEFRGLISDFWTVMPRGLAPHERSRVQEFQSKARQMFPMRGTPESQPPTAPE